MLEKYTAIKKWRYALKQILIGVLFGGASAFASSFGVEWLGAVVNVRDAAPLSAGLIFGGYAGIIAGLLTVGVSTLVISLVSGFPAAAAKSPEMGVSAMAVSFVIVPLVSRFTKNKDTERIENIFECFKED